MLVQREHPFTKCVHTYISQHSGCTIDDIFTVAVKRSDVYLALAELENSGELIEICSAPYMIKYEVMDPITRTEVDKVLKEFDGVMFSPQEICKSVVSVSGGPVNNVLRSIEYVLQQGTHDDHYVSEQIGEFTEDGEIGFKYVYRIHIHYDDDDEL